MKTLLTFLLTFVLAVAAFAANVKLGWDASADGGVTYTLKSWNFTVNPTTKARTRTTVKQTFPSVTGLVQDVNLPVGEHIMTVQAMWKPDPKEIVGIESDPSNDLFVLVPAAPGNLKIVQTPVANGMRLDIYGDKTKQLTLYRNNGKGWKKLKVFKNFKGEARFVDTNWSKSKNFEWKIEAA